MLPPFSDRHAVSNSIGGLSNVDDEAPEEIDPEDLEGLAEDFDPEADLEPDLEGDLEVNLDEDALDEDALELRVGNAVCTGT